MVGRAEERAVLDDLLAAVRRGQSRSLMLCGEPGIGKTSLLRYLAQQACDCHIMTLSGVASESGLAFAALQQLCGPMLDLIDVLPPPQREALRTTFGVSGGPGPDPLVLGLGVLGLLSAHATERPLVCLVDDALWLDRPSAQVLSFVARRIGDRPVALVVAARTPTPELVGLPRLVIDCLSEDDARALLAAQLTGPVDPAILDTFIAETRGHPLTLLELPRSTTTAELAGGYGLPGAIEPPRSIDESIRRLVRELPLETRRLVLLAAAEPLGDPALLWRAAKSQGIQPGAAQSAVRADLLELGARVRFRHPLVRSAVYRSASAEERREAHAALAGATDAVTDPDRRAWHRAQAASRADAGVADELERAAARAQARGGLAAAAAFLERATLLTQDPPAQARRALAAAHAKLQSDAFASAQQLLATAAAGPLDDLERARVELVRAQLALATARVTEASPLLMQAATRLEPVDVHLARTTYLDSLFAAVLAGRFAPPEADLDAVTLAAAATPTPRSPYACDLLLDGLVTTFRVGLAAGLPILREAVTTSGLATPEDSELRFLCVASRAAMHIWDDESALRLSGRFVELSRRLGALNEISLAVGERALLELLAGQPVACARLLEEEQTVVAARASAVLPFGAMGVAALRGDDAVALPLIEAHVREASARGVEVGIAGAEWARAVLDNGRGRYSHALVAAERANAYASRWGIGMSSWTLLELVEAATRTGAIESAASARTQLRDISHVSGTNWSLGVDALSRALANGGRDAEDGYRESTERLGATRFAALLARSHLLFGEWLRRERRRIEARSHLRTALEMFEAFGMEGFAERARRELRATGETAFRRTVETRYELTAQESQVALLARDGLSNPEIAARLFISSRTVQYHLGKVFAKLGISSRTQLDRTAL
jgi:DNA-binding CsgD family transcriptional regulator